MNPRYILHPGPVLCQKSGQFHYVSASTLARLYGVEMRDCIVFDPEPGNRMQNYAQCLHLYPTYDDTYAHPKVIVQPGDSVVNGMSVAS